MRLAVGISLVFAVFLLADSEAAVYSGIFKDPAHPGKCVVEGLVLNSGQTARHPKKCERVHCGENGNVEFHTCGAYGLTLGKRILLSSLLITFIQKPYQPYSISK
ncbi:uncharacterized protein Dana_GF26392 [Drosophila ananassae]|uniref:Single domain-containing protein n=1 Tax=Drosophila ananassae TaxID=7217 RepID=A0A0P8XY60_DROAN|nr:uncharacterized protein LOC26513801 [Drosophila ananassae]KPU74423.1 uncharacterized protein Dana_GF26392 [Drosophila ananassae]